MTEKKIDRVCEHCDGGFQVIPSRLKHGRGRHCSTACMYAARRARPKGVPFVCLACEAPFSLPPSIVSQHKGAGKYCSRECRDQHWVGPNTPNWQNGSGVYKRGPRWWAIRRRIRARDKVCQHCGSGSELQVHHKIPFRMFLDPDEANADDNLITLCPPCHRKEDSKHKWVCLPSGAILRFPSNGEAWKLVREKGMT